MKISKIIKSKPLGKLLDDIDNNSLYVSYDISVDGDIVKIGLSGMEFGRSSGVAHLQLNGDTIELHTRYNKVDIVESYQDVANVQSQWCSDD